VKEKDKKIEKEMIQRKGKEEKERERGKGGVGGK